MASIVASVSFVVGVWLYEFYFLPLGMALALLVAPMTKYLGRRSLGDDHEEEVAGREEEGDRKRSMVEDSQVGS